MMGPTDRALAPAARLKRRLDFWAVRLHTMPRIVRVQRMTHKWGSCSSAGTITLALDLDDEPEAFQEFVIVHELLHLRVPNHGRLFKALMSAHVPAWRTLYAESRTARSVSQAASIGGTKARMSC
jgi:predicted metal-dependent hydrolase